MAIVRVALPIPLPQVFDYVAVDATAADVGRCVKVPFGRGDRNGLIVALGEEGEVDAARLKAVHHIQRGVPALPPARFAPRPRLNKPKSPRGRERSAP